MAAVEDLFDPRRHGRLQALGLAQPCVGDWQCDPVDLLEISPGGFRALASSCPAEGETITIALPALGPITARVKWVDGSVFGAEFSGPADLRLLFLGAPVAPRTTWLERRAA